MNWKMIVACAALASAPLGCDNGSDGDDHGADTDDHDHEETELITTVRLTFTAEGGDTVTAAFSDPDGDGGQSGSAEPIVLAADTTYTLTVELLNELENEDITEEVKGEAEEHQFLFYGASVTGPASAGDGLVTHAYADVESDYGANTVGDDLPVGIANTITTTAAGTDGEFNVMLRHLPPINETPQKAAGLAEDFAQGGDLPGDTDVDVSFELSVE